VAADGPGQTSGGDSKHHVDQGFMDSPVLGLRTPTAGVGENSISKIGQHLNTRPSCILDAEHDRAPLRFSGLHLGGQQGRYLISCTWLKEKNPIASVK
jgi:hypothetical protein